MLLESYVNNAFKQHPPEQSATSPTMSPPVVTAGAVANQGTAPAGLQPQQLQQPQPQQQQQQNSQAAGGQSKPNTPAADPKLKQAVLQHIKQTGQIRLPELLRHFGHGQYDPKNPHANPVNA